MKKIIEALLLHKTHGYEEIQRALKIVEKFVKKNNLIMYGGMALNFSIITSGGDPIYPSCAVPDFDFFSSDNFNDSFILGKELFKAGFDKTMVLPAIHLTTRKVRINKGYYVADISYIPEPYFSFLPTQRYDGFLFVHPAFSRCDIHRSLALLYEGAPRENFRNRMSKDVERLNLLMKHCPFEVFADEKLKPKKVKLEKKYLFEYFSKKSEKQQQPPTEVCLCGEQAYIAYLAILKSDFPEFDTADLMKLETPAVVEFIKNFSAEDVKLYKEKKCKYFCQTLGIFPEAIVDLSDNVKIYYQNNGLWTAANKTKNFSWIAGIHNTMANFAMKYFCTHDAKWRDLYLSCEKILKLDPFFGGPAKNESKRENYPFFINSAYFGRENFTQMQMYNYQRIDCMTKKINFQSSPNKTFNVSQTEQIVDYNKFVAYQIDGSEIAEFPVRNYTCQHK